MRVLCLTDKYYPEASANTVCADIVMNYFKKLGAKVDFLSILQVGNSDCLSVYNDSNVIKIKDYCAEYLSKYGKKFNAKTWLDMPVLFRKILGLKKKICMPFRLYTGYNALDCVNYKNVIKQVKSVCDCYDAVISFSMPFALHVVARKLKSKGLAKKWFPVFLDPFVNNKCMPQGKLKIKYRQFVSKKVLKEADKIFMVRGIVEENKNQKYNPYYHNNVIEIDLPNLVKQKLPKGSNNQDKIDMLYAGVFYKDIRNPEKMFDILSSLSEEFSLTVCGQGCEDIVNEKKELFTKAEFNYLGKIDYDKCLKKIANSNILINLGNTITNQTPSKIFEYIGFGKPILNFYFDEKDTSLYYLKKYPLALNINLNLYKKEDIKNIIKFCKDNKNKTLSFEEATKNLKENVSEKICERIYNIVKNA